MLHLVSCSPTKLQLKPTLYIIELVHYIQVESPRLHSKREEQAGWWASQLLKKQEAQEYNAHATSAKATATDFAASRVAAGAEDEAPAGGVVPLPVAGASAGQA